MSVQSAIIYRCDHDGCLETFTVAADLVYTKVIEIRNELDWTMIRGNHYCPMHKQIV